MCGFLFTFCDVTYIIIEKYPSRVSCHKMEVIADILGVDIGDIFLQDYHTNSEVKEIRKE